MISTPKLYIVLYQWHQILQVILYLSYSMSSYRLRETWHLSWKVYVVEMVMHVLLDSSRLGGLQDHCLLVPGTQVALKWSIDFNSNNNRKKMYVTTLEQCNCLIFFIAERNENFTIMLIENTNYTCSLHYIPLKILFACRILMIDCTN